MRFLAVLSLLALSHSVPAQQESRQQELLDRVGKLEAENIRLRSEVDRLRALEADLRHLKLLGRDHDEEQLEAGAPQVMPAMPYDEDLYFVVKSARSEGNVSPTGEVRHTLIVDLLELAPANLKDATEVERGGWTWVVLGADARAGARPYRMKVEELKPGAARRWLGQLEPIAETGPEGVVTRLHRRVGFRRVPTDASYMGRYPGNSGTVRIHRKKFHWYENSVFFLENGVLRVLGAKSAQHHLRFFVPLRRSE